MRRGGKRVRQAIELEDQKLIAEGKTDEVEAMRKKVADALGGVGVKTKGLTREEWKTPVRGYVLPEGDGVCVARMQVVGETVVFFSEGQVSALRRGPMSLANERNVELTRRRCFSRLATDALRYTRSPSHTS